MLIRGVFFDFHDTLTICDDAAAAWEDWSLALYGVLREHGAPLPEEPFRQRCRRMFDAPEPPSHNGLTIYERRIGAFCREMGWQPDEGALRTAAAASAVAWHCHNRLDEHARPLLEWLRERTSVALISNFDHPRHLHAVLKDWQLDSLFDLVLVSGDLGMSKPNPAIYRHALQTLDLEPAAVACVGDADTDVDGARAAGCIPVRIRRTPDAAACPTGANGALTIARLDELPGALGLLSAPAG